MKLKPNPHTDRLAKGLDKCLALTAAWENDVCRTSGTKHATIKKFADGAGAKQWGGRWNPPGIAAVYCSLDEETALAEMKQRHRRGGIPLKQMKPRVFASVHVRLKRVLDLTQSKVLKTLKVSLKQLLEEWQGRRDGEEEAIPQAIGRLAWERGVDGLLVPSAAALPHGGVNLVVYPDRAPNDWCEIHHEDDLPKDNRAKRR